MQTLAVIATKGGVGKTTLATHIAAAAQNAGRRVRILDLDPQQSSRSWAERRAATLAGEGRGPVLDGVDGYARKLAALLADAEAAGVDLVVVDTAPHQTTDTSNAARLADIVLVPVKPGVFDLEAMRTTLDMLDATRAFAFAVVNDVTPAARALADEAAALVADADLPVAPVRLANRVAYVTAPRDGLAAPEAQPRGEHVREIAELWDWLRTQLPAAAAHRRRRAAQEPSAPAAPAAEAKGPAADFLRKVYGRKDRRP